MAFEALRAAATQERSHFDLDQVNTLAGVPEIEPDATEWDDVPDDHRDASQQGRLEGQAAELAKNLRSAPAAR